MPENNIELFEGRTIRRIWDADKQKWYFSVVDVVTILTGSSNPQVYWRVLKKRLLDEGADETVTKCNGLKMIAPDGKMRITDTADLQTIFRIIQSIPSPKAEPFKQWLAKVGNERVQEIANPEESLNRARENWQKLGRSEKWIQQRMTGQETRNKLTDYWKDHDVKEQDEYAILTNIIHQEWTDITVKEHKKLKKLKNENLRDHMTEAELIFTALAELSTRQIAENMQTMGLEQNKIPAHKGGRIAKNARLELEKKTGKKVISKESFKIPENSTRKLKKP